MRAFHTIAGLPRAGSTLLCNILNQNPAFLAGSTSALPGVVAAAQLTLSNAVEVKSDLASDREGTEAYVERILRGIVESRYSDASDRVVFDKSRGWSAHAQLLSQLFPRSRMIVCVRDLRDVLASVEKQHARFPALDDASSPLARTVLARADRLFSPDGMIGLPLAMIEDLVRREWPSMVVVSYEYLAANPEAAVRKLYDALEEPFFEGHDFSDVANTATDLDALYLGKFPHDTSGPIRRPERSAWKAWVPGDVAELVMGRFANFNRAFGYT